MSELLVLGISHKTAPVALRERVALLDGRAETVVEELVADPDVVEAVAISTCNRTEIYLAAANPVAAENAVLSILSRQAGIRPTELVEPLYALRNCDAARHLYRVTAGLDSMIVGESEIQGQVKRAYESALAIGATGPMLNKLFHAALATGKRVRSETQISASRVNISTVAVQLAQESIGNLHGRRVLILGAGEMSELTAQALVDQGVHGIFVANRRRDRAEALAHRFDGTVVGFDHFPSELEHADIVLASTSSPHPIVGQSELREVMAARNSRPLLLIDIAVPRDIEPECAALDGVTLYDMDDLQDVVRRNRSVRSEEALLADDIVEEEITRFAGWLGSLEVLPTVAALRQRGDDIVEGVLAENEDHWETVSEADRERIAAIARTVANRLLHEPTLRMKRTEDERTHARLQVIRDLFGLDADASSEGAADRSDDPGVTSDAVSADVRELPRRADGRSR